MLNAMTTERQVAVAGDWHNDTTWMMNVFSRISTKAPEVRTILHLGDLEIGNDRHAKSRLNFIDERCRGNHIERVLVTPGNHDNWDRLEEHDEWAHGMPAPLSDRVWALPPGFRFILGGHTFLSFGGAASLQQNLLKGKNWWPQEVRSPGEFATAGSAGHAHVMLTHEAVDAGLRRVESVISGTGRSTWLPERVQASAQSRRLITGLWNAVQPEILLHGHMHIRDEATLQDGRRVFSLADSREKLGNMGILDATTLSWEWH